MASKYIITVDLAKISFPTSDPEKKDVRVLGWGDVVEIDDPATDITDKSITATVVYYNNTPDGSVVPIRKKGTITPTKSLKAKDILRPKAESDILKVDFVDVQQGDGMVVETPGGKVMLIDGGDNQLFARYLANRFPNSTDDNPRIADAILVTHGDADHFVGLSKIRDSEENSTPTKRLFLAPRRVLHNGLVKRPSKTDGRDTPETALLGKAEKVTDMATGKEVLVVTELETDLTQVHDDKLNGPFKRWKEDLIAYSARLAAKEGVQIAFSKIEKGDSASFDFLSEDPADQSIRVNVLGPIPIDSTDGKHGFRYLREPKKGPRSPAELLGTDSEEKGSYSASHTINGHSIVFQLIYGGFTFLFSGDLNDEAERILTRAHNRNELNLQSEVFKVPHHGSHDFSGAFLRAVAPVISVVSSGDESERKEYIHPRATLVGALGRFSRVDEPIIFITELVAFFKTEGWVSKDYHALTEDARSAIKKRIPVANPTKHDFFSFSRAAFGIVMARTDGKRLLVYTNSALANMKEAYAFEMDPNGSPKQVPIRSV